MSSVYYELLSADIMLPDPDKRADAFNALIICITVCDLISDKSITTSLLLIGQHQVLASHYLKTEGRAQSWF